MSKLIVFEWITLDGVFDSDPEYFEEWFIPYHNNERAEYITNTISNADILLFGRESYEMLYPHWSKQTDDSMGPASSLNNLPKYVVSNTLEKVDWNNSSVIDGDLGKQIQNLKDQSQSYVLILGSARLVRSLMEMDLIDKYKFLVHPVIMGDGKHLFDKNEMEKLELIDSQIFETGVIAVAYSSMSKN